MTRYEFNKQMEALTGVSIYNKETVKTVEEVWGDLAKVWKTIGQENKLALCHLLGGISYGPKLYSMLEE